MKSDIYFAPFDNTRRKNKIFKKGVIFVKKGKLETFLVVWSESLMWIKQWENIEEFDSLMFCETSKVFCVNIYSGGTLNLTLILKFLIKFVSRCTPKCSSYGQVSYWIGSNLLWKVLLNTDYVQHRHMRFRTKPLKIVKKAFQGKNVVKLM